MQKVCPAGVDVAIKADGPDHERTAYYRTALASVQIERREYAAAETQLDAALVNSREASGRPS